jgi:hypothetical protein
MNLTDAKEHFLVVKTGHTATLRQLHSTELTINDKQVKLSGNWRLTGTIYRSIIHYIKDQAGPGTYSVVAHNPEDIQQLTHEYSQTMALLKANTDFRVVATIPHTFNQLNEATKEVACIYQELVQLNLLKPNPKKADNYLYINHDAMREYFKQYYLNDGGIQKVLSKYINDQQALRNHAALQPLIHLQTETKPIATLPEPLFQF